MWCISRPASVFHGWTPCYTNSIGKNGEGDVLYSKISIMQYGMDSQNWIGILFYRKFLLFPRIFSPFKKNVPGDTWIKKLRMSAILGIWGLFLLWQQMCQYLNVWPLHTKQIFYDTFQCSIHSYIHRTMNIYPPCFPN